MIRLTDDHFWYDPDIMQLVFTLKLNVDDAAGIQKQIVSNQEKAERLENKFQLLLKYTGRDVVSCIQHIKLLEQENKQLKELLGENK